MVTLKYIGKKNKDSVRIPINGKQYSHGDNIVVDSDNEKQIKKQLPTTWLLEKESNKIKEGNK